MCKQKFQWPLLIGILLVSGVAFTATPMTDAAADERGVLAQIIQLYEVRVDRSNQKVPLAFGGIAQDVDINSVIKIRVNPEALTLALGGGKASPASTHEIRALEIILIELRSLAELFTAALQDAARLQQLDAEGQRNSQEFKDLAEQVEDAFRKFFTPLQSYHNALKTSTSKKFRDRAAYFDARLRDTVRKIKPGKGHQITAELLSEELTWVNTQIERLAQVAQTTLQSVALVIIARAFTEGQEPQRVHLEHYDSLPSDQLESLEKINWASDSAEMRRLLEATRPIVSTLEDIQNKRIDIRTGMELIFAAHDIDVTPLLISIEALAGVLNDFRETDWPEEFRLIIKGIEKTLVEETLDDSQRQNLREIMALAQSIRDDAKEVLISFDLLETELTAGSLTNLVEEAERRTNPVDSLITLLDGIDRGVRQVEEWQATLNGLGAKFKKILVKIGQAAKNVQSLGENLENLQMIADTTLQDGFERLQTTQFARLLENVTAVREQVNALNNALDRLREDESGRLELYAGTDFPIPADAYYVIGQNIKNTNLDLRTIRDRRDSTPVVLEALLFRIEPERAEGASAPKVKIGEQIDKEKQTLRMHRFGVYSVPNVGVAYVSSSDELRGQSERTNQFSVQVSWLFRYRSWIEDTSFNRPALLDSPWWNDIGIGIHAVALDLNKDNEQEIGVGLTLSLLKDIVQLGYGVNLTLDEEQYFFVALKLFQFGQALNIDR